MAAQLLVMLGTVECPNAFFLGASIPRIPEVLSHKDASEYGCLTCIGLYSLVSLSHHQSTWAQLTVGMLNTDGQTESLLYLRNMLSSGRRH